MSLYVFFLNELNMTIQHLTIYIIHMWWIEENTPKGSGTTRRCGLLVLGVVLLEEVCHCGGLL